MPQPLSSIAPKASYILGNNAHTPDYNQHLATMAFSVIIEWSVLERVVNSLFVAMLGGEAPSAAVIFATIRSQAGQRDAIGAVAEHTIQDQAVRDAILAVLAVYKGASKTRNRIAHWVWGYSPDVPEAVLLVDPTALTARDARSSQELAKWMGDMRAPPPTEGASREGMWVYEERDFEEALAKIQRASLLVGQVTDYASGHRSPDDPQWHRLLAEPEIARELDRLNKGRQSDP